MYWMPDHFDTLQMERRDRLRKLLAEMDDDEKLDKLGASCSPHWHADRHCYMSCNHVSQVGFC